MLRELRIENLAIIESLDLEFDDNLIVLTGETGAGKSIILNGINLLIGERANTELIRDGADYLLAEGVFSINENQELELSEKGIEVEESEIIVQRRIDKNGKGKAFINGRRVPLNVLREIMDTLVDLVGQHTHQVLLNKNHHIKLIDRFLDSDSIKLKTNLKEAYDNYSITIKDIHRLKEVQDDIKDKKELYEFQFNEISNLKLILNEDSELEDEYKKLFNSGKIKENLESSLMILKENELNVLKMISGAKKNIEQITRYGKEYEEIMEKLEKVYYELEDVVYYISDTNSDTDSDEYRLNEVVDRLDKINNLKKKYGNSIEEILEYKSELEEKLNKLGYNNFELEKLEKEKTKLLSEYKKLSVKLSSKRKEIAKRIEKMLIEELKDLKMESAKFKIFFGQKEALSVNGQDEVEFMITTNIGQDYKPLTKIVSGGEVSRIMLSLKSIFSKVDSIPILIFDEIDTGVGGETVRKVAEKLKKIGDYAQVMCITHSPAIASKAKQQFYIKKSIIKGQTVTNVKELNEEERLAEIARMIAGENITETVLTHARELLKEGY